MDQKPRWQDAGRRKRINQLVRSRSWCNGLEMEHQTYYQACLQRDKTDGAAAPHTIIHLPAPIWLAASNLKRNHHYFNINLCAGWRHVSCCCCCRHRTAGPTRHHFRKSSRPLPPVLPSIYILYSTRCRGEGGEGGRGVKVVITINSICYVFHVVTWPTPHPLIVLPLPPL